VLLPSRRAMLRTEQETVQIRGASPADYPRRRRRKTRVPPGLACWPAPTPPARPQRLPRRGHLRLQRALREHGPQREFSAN